MKLILPSKKSILMAIGMSLAFIVCIRIVATPIFAQYGFEYATPGERIGDIRETFIGLINFIIVLFFFVYMFIFLSGLKKKKECNDAKKIIIVCRIITNGILGIMITLILYVLNPLIWAKNDKFNPNLNHGSYGWLEKIPGSMVTIVFLNIIILSLPLLRMTLSKKTATYSSVAKKDSSGESKDKNS